jgi:hypothetical protein
MKTFQEFLQNKRQFVLEATQAVGSDNLGFFVKNILETIQKPNVSVMEIKEKIKGLIYQFLTHTSQFPDDVIPQGFASKYMENLPKIPINSSETTVIDSGSWVHFKTNITLLAVNGLALKMKARLYLNNILV